jgi:hypothetical protein
VLHGQVSFLISRVRQVVLHRQVGYFESSSTALGYWKFVKSCTDKCSIV